MIVKIEDIAYSEALFQHQFRCFRSENKKLIERLQEMEPGEAISIKYEKIDEVRSNRALINRFCKAIGKDKFQIFQVSAELKIYVINKDSKSG